MDVSVDMNIEVTHAESYTHNRQTRRRKEVVNTLYKETAEKINAKQPNRAKKIGRRRRRWCIAPPRAGWMRSRDEGRERKVSAGNAVWHIRGGARGSLPSVAYRPAETCRKKP